MLININICYINNLIRYPHLLVELLADPQWSPQDIGLLAGQNLLRVFSQVEIIRDAWKRAAVQPGEDHAPPPPPPLTACRSIYNSWPFRAAVQAIDNHFNHINAIKILHQLQRVIITLVLPLFSAVGEQLTMVGVLLLLGAIFGWLFWIRGVGEIEAARPAESHDATDEDEILV